MKQNISTNTQANLMGASENYLQIVFVLILSLLDKNIKMPNANVDTKKC